MRPRTEFLTIDKFLLWAALLGLCVSGCEQAPATATIGATWTIIDTTYPDPNVEKERTCAELDVATVRIDVDDEALSDFPCERYSGQTDVIASGVYRVMAIAFDSTGTVLWSSEFNSVYAYGQTSLGKLRIRIP